MTTEKVKALEGLKDLTDQILQDTLNGTAADQLPRYVFDLANAMVAVSNSLLYKEAPEELEEESPEEPEDPYTRVVKYLDSFLTTVDLDDLPKLFSDYTELEGKDKWLHAVRIVTAIEQMEGMCDPCLDLDHAGCTHTERNPCACHTIHSAVAEGTEDELWLSNAQAAAEAVGEEVMLVRGQPGHIPICDPCQVGEHAKCIGFEPDQSCGCHLSDEMHIQATHGEEPPATPEEEEEFVSFLNDEEKVESLEYTLEWALDQIARVTAQLERVLNDLDRRKDATASDGVNLSAR